ncbi:MAG: PaaI family thioesterase [Marinilabiliaceae bacterium]|nr:PaaI family thioesterase [Marinilabiliaceae bacterium]
MSEQNVKDFFSNDRFAVLAGVVIDEVGEGRATAHIDVEDRHLNANGFCQGGAIFTLADTTLAVAVNTRELNAVSVEANILYINAVTKGRLEAEAIEVVNHHRLPSMDVTLRQNGQVVAKMTSLCYRKSKK